MTTGSWWETDPARVRLETDALDAAGMPWRRTDPAGTGGLLELDATVPGPDGDVTLHAVYPDEFPYFPPHVTGPDIGFEHHYAHGGGAVCLLAPGGRDWLPSRTLAWLLTEQWPKVVAANQGDGTAPDGTLIETDQAEPWTAYVRTEEGAVVVLDSAAVPPNGAVAGPLAYVSIRPKPVGAVVVAMGDGNADFFNAGALNTIDPSKRAGWWMRLDAVPHARDAAGLWAAAEAQDPTLRERGWGPHPERGPIQGKRDHAMGRQMQTVLLCIPEETSRRHTGIGWIALTRTRAEPKKPAGQARAVRVSRAGHDDLYLRAPGLAAVKDKTVLLVGNGGLGSAIGVELGKLALAGLRLADADGVDPAAAVRFPGAFRFAGMAKVAAIGQLALETQPYTRVTPVGLHLGRPRRPDEPDTRALLAEQIDAADLVIDATADLGAQQLLSDRCRQAETAYLQAEATPGVWAGLVCLYLPGTDLCWVCVQHHIHDGTIPELPRTTGPAVQPPGCLEPTYPGAGFDLAVIAAQAVRQAVSYLTAGPGGYGPPAAGVLTVALRDHDGNPVLPTWQQHLLARHPDCPNHP